MAFGIIGAHSDLCCPNSHWHDLIFLHKSRMLLLWLNDIVSNWSLGILRMEATFEELQFCKIWQKKVAWLWVTSCIQRYELSECVSERPLALLKMRLPHWQGFTWGLCTAQIKCPRDWQLTGVDATGGRTGQSFPLHILSDKILLFSNARHAGSRYVMLWVSSVSVQSQTSSRLARDSNSNAFLHLVPFSTALILMKNSPCFAGKLYWGLNPIQKSFALAGNMGWKKNIG